MNDREPPRPSAVDRDTLDHRHESDVRGEHRYPGGEETEPQRKARADRDELKRRMQSTVRFPT